MGSPRKRRIALALGSGAARGWSHIGVIRAFEEAGVEIDMVCGASVGTVVGAALAAGKVDELEEWVRGLDGMDVLRLLDAGLSEGGFLRGAKLLRAYAAFVDERDIEALDMPFAAVATDIETGREVWLRKGSLHDSIRASCALPGLFPPVCIDDRWLVDGGLVNPVPVSLARAMDADIVVAVNLNGDLVGAPGARHRYARPGDSKTGAWQRARDWWASRGTTRGMLKTVFSGSGGDEEPPGILSVVADSIDIMQDRVTRARLVGEPPDMLISPQLSRIGILEFERAAEAIDEGHACAERVIPDIRQLLDD